MDFEPGPLLARIDTPADLRQLPAEKLPQVCNELRQYIIDVVSKKGGHFGASLGVVEMTTALHYVFNTPYDQLVWDVGHQAYGHKILTGRRKVFPSNRIYKGISGFPKRKESEYDTFGVGHSSTSISAALGMAVASKLNKENDRHHIAVIGDGAMTGGMAFEALNHAGVSNANLLVVLNDNCMSIDPNVGALKQYLTDITTSRTYNAMRDEVWNLLGHISKFGPNAQDIASKIEHGIKGTLLKSGNLFESLNFRYFGPIDGHDVKHMVKILEDLRDIPGPKILHCVTVKGKGYGPSETGNATKWHAPGLFDKTTGEVIKVVPKGPEPPKFQDVFGHTLVELAELNDKVVGVTPAMPTGCSMTFLMEAMPHRAFDVGIAEQHAVTFSAGLATQGMVPFCNIYSTFMQRAFDQVIHDVALQDLHVVFCLDRGGLVGADGATHHGAFDLAYMRCIPNMIVCSPLNEEELRNLMFTAQTAKGTWSIRYPRGNGVMADWQKPMRSIKIGTGQCLCDGDDLAFLAIGPLGNTALEAANDLKADGLNVAVYDMRFVKPLDTALLNEVFTKHSRIITVEDGCLMGGFGSAVVEWAMDNGHTAQVRRLGIPDRFIDHGSPTELTIECGFSKTDMIAAAQALCGVTVRAAAG